MILMTNPYDLVNLDAFEITEVGVIKNRAVFRVHTTNRKPFDVCVFRDHLVRDLMENLDGEDWFVGYDGTFIQFTGGDLTIAVGSPEARRYIRETYCDQMYAPMGVRRQDAPTTEEVV